MKPKKSIYFAHGIATAIILYPSSIVLIPYIVVCTFGVALIPILIGLYVVGVIEYWIYSGIKFIFTKGNRFETIKRNTSKQLSIEKRLLEYIEKAFEKKLPYAVVENNLLLSGWSEIDIENAMKVVIGDPGKIDDLM